MPTFIEKVEKIKMPYRIVILTVTILIIAAIGYFAIYSNLSTEIKKNEDAIFTLDKEIKKAVLREKDLAKFEAEQAKAEEDFKLALKLLPNESEIPNLLRNITALGIESGLEFVLFSPKNEVPKDFYYEIPVSIEVIGKYHDVASFFDKVGRMDRIVNISQVSMKPKETLSTTLDTTCNAVTFKFKPKGSDDEKGKKKKRTKRKPKKKNK